MSYKLSIPSTVRLAFLTMVVSTAVLAVGSVIACHAQVKPVGGKPPVLTPGTVAIAWNKNFQLPKVSGIKFVQRQSAAQLAAERPVCADSTDLQYDCGQG